MGEASRDLMQIDQTLGREMPRGLCNQLSSGCTP